MAEAAAAEVDPIREQKQKLRRTHTIGEKQAIHAGSERDQKAQFA